jgi:hypothetical protein
VASDERRAHDRADEQLPCNAERVAAIAALAWIPAVPGAAPRALDVRGRSGAADHAAGGLQSRDLPGHAPDRGRRAGHEDGVARAQLGDVQ